MDLAANAHPRVSPAPRTPNHDCSLPTYKIGPVGLPVAEPPGGSRVTASAAVFSNTLPRFTMVAPSAEMTPSDRGAPSAGTAHNSSERSACTLTLTSGLVTIARPSLLMLATNDAGTTPLAAGPVALRTTTIGGRAGPGGPSSTAKLSAATPAMPATPRHSAS